MITRRLLATTSLAAASLAACGKIADSGGGDDAGVLHFSVLSTESAQNMASYWDPVIVDMQKATGLTIKPFFSSNYTALIEAMRFKQTDAGWFSNQSGMEAVRRANGEVFARTFDASGVDGYKSVIIVGAKSGLTLDRVLKCDRSLSFGIGDPKSTSGTLAPMTYLFAPRNIKPETCFKVVRSANHQSNLFAVANGVMDVATNNSKSLELNLAHGRHETDHVKVIWESPTLPEDPIIWRKDLDPAVKEKLRQFFLTYAEGTSADAVRQRGYLAKLSIGGFKPADNSHLLPVEEMEATENWLLAKTSGDAAKIAATRKALDDITAQREALEARTRAPAGAQ